MATLFKACIGEEAKVTNIEQDFSVGALILSQLLKEILIRHNEEKEKAAESLCTKGIERMRLYKATNTTYCKSIGIVLDQTGVLRSDLCRNEGVKGGKCTKFRGMYAHINCHWEHLKLSEIFLRVDNDDVMPNEDCEMISIANLSDKIDTRVADSLHY